tara:strand:- start:272 stop:1315 length:1044 start_codon:yes stop_codon:yes gene_type:complete
MSTKPKVTILTLVYNGYPYLQETVESVLNQSCRDFIYLIIDDCSTDNSYNYLKSIKDDRIILVKNEINLGVSNTFNKALKMISTPFLIRLDQDDIALPNRVQEQTNFLSTHSSIDVICSWEYIINEKGQTIGLYKSKVSNYGEFLTPLFLGLCPIWHPSLACRTNALREIGGFNDKFKRAEDFDVTARLALSRMNASICQKFHLKVRRHSQQQSNQYKLKQLEVSREVVSQSISHFVENEKDSDMLARFFSRRIPLKILLNEYKLKYLSQVYNSFLKSVIQNQLLNEIEIKSMKKIISSRVGSGLTYFNRYSALPLHLDLVLFLIFSPRYILARLLLFLTASINSKN